eukprot:TRINITY_DN4731_c0_g1_i4.p3 TRINITY_DN4731_c0_g1~~TRINITY_DN4731_c0_g1_i4.p3  ORF type:complete len:100 (+),score=3.22 TRINITY_DN4731_c0_g1_i4:239-538(+)
MAAPGVMFKSFIFKASSATGFPLQISLSIAASIPSFSCSICFTINIVVSSSTFKLIFLPVTVLTVICILYPMYSALIPCLLYTSPSPRDLSTSRMPSSA